MHIALARSPSLSYKHSIANCAQEWRRYNAEPVPLSNTHCPAMQRSGGKPNTNTNTDSFTQRSLWCSVLTYVHPRVPCYIPVRDTNACSCCQSRNILILGFCILLRLLYHGYKEKNDRLCGLVVRVLGYRSGGPGSIPGITRKKNLVGLERGHSASWVQTEELLDRKVEAPV
jgi:hypothetical protein